MAYPIPDTNKNLIDILDRKEFMQYRYDPARDFKSGDVPDPYRGQLLESTSYQQFDRNYMNPDTKVNRFLLKYDTGTGKTLAAILIALGHIKNYRSIYQFKRTQMQATGSIDVYELNKLTPTVFVLGYSPTKTAFYRDLLKYPEFGYISYSERDELRRLERIARSGFPEDIARHHDYKKRLKRTITTKSRGGFFKFIGYKKLVNMLFISRDINLTDLENSVKSDPTSKQTLEDIIYEYVRDGKIQVNIPLLEQFRDSLIIADEIHNTYNMNMKNNYGVALQYILNYHPSVKALFLTATPINNSPQEVVDLLDLLLPENMRVKHDELFAGGKITPAGLQKIGHLITGRISFIQDVNPKYFPERIFVGEDIRVGKITIPYLKFIRCPASELHRKAFITLQREGYQRRENIIDADVADDIAGGFVDSFVNSCVDGGNLSVKNQLYEFSKQSDDKSGVSLDRGTDPSEEKSDIGGCTQCQSKDGGCTQCQSKDGGCDDCRGHIGGCGCGCDGYGGGCDECQKKVGGCGCGRVGYGIIDDGGILGAAAAVLGPQDRHHNAATAFLGGVIDVDDDAADDDAADDVLAGAKNMKLSGELTPINELKIPPDGASIYDMVFPNPSAPGTPLYRSSDTKIKIMEASAAERRKFGADVVKGNITGSFLHINNIAKYSAKYYRLIKEIWEVLAVKQIDAWKRGKKQRPLEQYGQKIMIYHRRVAMSGVKLIAELMMANGILDEISNPVNNTLCAICGTPMGKHQPPDKHDYRPCRFAIVHSDVDEKVWQQSLDKFNALDNIYGTYIKIFIGSKKIQEGFDIKYVQHLFVVAMPVDISSLLQVLGRVSRKESHDALPPELHKVFVYILVTSWEKQNPAKMLSPDEQRYLDKLLKYIDIQEIEKQMHIHAVDANIHRDRIMPPELLAKYFPGTRKTQPVNSLGNLYFEPAFDLPFIDARHVDLRTFNPYGHHEIEIANILYLIKRLFMQTPVWTYDELWRTIREPPFGIETNPKMFAEGNFVIALNKMMTREHFVDHVSANAIEMLRNIHEKYILINGRRHVIEQVGEYYIRFPVEEPADGHIGDTEMENIGEPYVIRDIESYNRPATDHAGIIIPLAEWTTTTALTYQYDAKRKNFKQRILHGEAMPDLMLSFNAEFLSRILDEAIEYNVAAEIGSAPGGLKKNAEEEKMFDIILEFFDDFGGIIYAGDVIKYKSTAKTFTNKKIIKVNGEGVPALQINRGVPIGHLTKTTVRLSDYPKWIEVSKTSLNIRTQYLEGTPIIGYVEPTGNIIKFKYRRADRDRAGVRDTRTLERGSSCDTRSKRDIINIVNELNIKVSAEMAIKDICNKVYMRLLEKEMAERKKESKVKYFYMFYDEVPK